MGNRLACLPTHLRQVASALIEDLVLEQVSSQGLVLCREDQALCDLLETSRDLLETSLCQPTPGILVGQLFCLADKLPMQGFLGPRQERFFGAALHHM